MKNRALTIIAILLGAFIIGAVIYLVTQKTAQQQIGSYKTGVAYPTSPISMSLWPVSYTHLDVYKRQGFLMV